MQQLQRFSEGEARILEHGMGQPALHDDGNQIRLIRQQHRTYATFAECGSEGIALLQKAELRG